MSWKCYAGSLALLVIGGFLGNSLASGGKYGDGRLSACNDLVGIMNSTSPILMMAGGVRCVAHNGDAALQLGDKLFTLDGKTEIKQ